MSLKTKSKSFKSVVWLALTFCLKAISITEEPEIELEMTQFNMPKFLFRVTKRHKMYNHTIRETAHERKGHKVTTARLLWCGHVNKKDVWHICQKVLSMNSSVEKKEDRPKRRFLDCLKQDLREVNMLAKNEKYTIG